MGLATIQVFPEKVRFPLNEEMYGVFYEEINHAGDGGLYAELIRNRSFMDARLPEGTAWYKGKACTALGHSENHDLSDDLPGWHVRMTGAARAQITGSTDAPRNPTVPNQLYLVAEGTSEGSVALLNDGYWGISVEPGEYRLTVIVRGNVPSLRVSLEMQYGGEAGCVQIDGVTSVFTKFEVLFAVTKKANGCRLAINPLSDGELWFDFVSLFPVDTFCERKNGMNRRIAEKIKALRPGFLRFPGGCIVEGISLENAFQFEKTLGPVEDRPGCWDLWGYRRTDGIGYHEYLEFCEDLGASGMYVINCGMSCQWRESEHGTPEQIDAFLQSAISAIDYAIASPEENEWGALRAKNGHPAPFPLKYIEIGNENWGAQYIERYNQFYRVLKKKYPQLIYIINDIGRYPDIRPEGYDLFDEHFYVTPQRFPAMAHRYDTYPRNGKKIYVGEYAANQEVGIGNMAAACAEASFMINMERNGDVVKMASYAPLLCHMRDRRWPVNLICYEDGNIFGIPSYHVQKLFSEVRPRVIVQSNCNVSSFTGETKVDTVSGLDENGDLIVKISNFSKGETTVCITAEGFVPASLIGISADSPETENSIDDPEKVCAVELPPTASFNMRPYGVYVLRMEAE